MNKQVDVLIVGAGIGGLILALALGRKGFRVGLWEYHQNISKPMRGEIVQPNGLKVLKQMGLLEEVESQNIHKNHYFHFHNTQGEKLLTVDYRMLPEPFNYSLLLLPQRIHDVLMKSLSQVETVDLCFGVGLERMLRSRNSWRVSGKGMGQTFEWDARVVVGGDGISSKVRKFAEIPFRIHRYKDAYLTMVVQRPPGFEAEGRYYIGKKEILALFPVSRDELYLFYLMPLKQKETIQSRRIENLHEAIFSIDPCVKEALKKVTSWEQVGIMPCTRVKVGSWVADGVALLGDAAHGMNPHVAQGGNQAMEDGVVLSEVIESCFAMGDFSRDALQEYEENRRPKAECLQRLGDELTFVWNSGFAPMVWLRERIFRQIQRNPSLQYTTLATIAGVHSKRYSLLERMKALGVLND